TMTNVYQFDGTNWTEVAGMPAGRYVQGAGVLNGAFYAIGGYDSGSRTNVYRFDGTNWTQVAGLPAGRWGPAAGVLNGVLYSAGGNGASAATNVYRYPATVAYIGVAPVSGSFTGGYSVVISGTNLCDGTLGDVTNATLCGAEATVIGVAGSTQIVVTAGVASFAGLGDVRVFSVSFGETVKYNAFTYMKLDQTINFPAIGSKAQTDVAGLAATASSGLEVSFATNGGPAVISDGTNLSFTGVGMVNILASQAGNGIWNPAPDVTNTVQVYALTAYSGPYAGGNTITITNGHFGAITNVTVGGVAATIQNSGDNWVRITVPAVGSAGAKDIVIQTSDSGDTTLIGAYTVNPSGQIGWVEYGPPGWTNLGLGMNQWVLALAHDGQRLYAGGQFGSAGGSPAAYLASWDGSSWTNVGGGVGNLVYDLLCKGSELYVGGAFTNAGGVAANYVAMWNGSVWTNLGEGVDMDVYALAHDGTNLYAAGVFTNAGGMAANHVAMWNGSNWTNLGSGMDHNVHDLAYDGARLYAGGVFTNAGGAGAQHVAMWDGNNWTQLGAGTDIFVFKLLYDGSSLYAGGNFMNAGGASASRIAKWNGSAWTNLGAGLSDQCSALDYDGTNLFAGGTFTNAGGIVARYVAQWNPSIEAWTNVGSGMSDYVYELTRDKANLYAGGRFTMAGGVPANYVAKWGPSVNAFSGVQPSSGSVTGGYSVVITGSNLCDGADVADVTLCGVSVASIDSQSITQIVVTAAAALASDPGDVRVFSISFGETVKSNAFTYLRENQAPLVFSPATPQTYLTTNTLSLSGGSGTGAVSYEVVSGPGSIAGSNLAVTAGTGTIALRAAKAQDDLYNESAVTGLVAAAKAGQMITNFVNPGAQETTNTVSLSAQADSGLACTFSVLSGPGVLFGSTLTFTNAGDVSIVASQAGDTNWNAAPDVTNTFTVTKATAGVTLNGLNQTYDGTPRIVSVLTVPTDLVVRVTYDGLTNPPLNSGSYMVTGVVNDVMYQGFQTGVLVVAKGTAGVYLANLAQVYDGTAKSVTATSDPSGLTVSLTYDGHAWAPTNAASYAVTGTVNDANYQGSAVDTLFIDKADQTITSFLPANGAVFVESDTAGLSATASSGLPAGFTTNSGPAMIIGGTNLSFMGHGAVTIVAGQSGNGNYNPAPNVTNGFIVLGLFDVVIRSEHGAATPGTGTYTYVEGATVTNTVTSLDAQDKTQFVSAGWAMSGNEPATGATNQCVIIVTNDATLTWLWTTNYWLNTEAGPHGTVNVGDGWQAFGVTTSITATADQYYHFTNWTGDAGGGANPLDLLMDAPKSVTANFTATMTTSAPAPVPYEWLADYGQTNFEEDVVADPDHDGQFTWEEYAAAATDPTNPLSFFHTEVDPGGIMLLSWPSATGRVYDVQQAHLVEGYEWSVIAGRTNLPATPPMNTVTNPSSAMTNAMQFFRAVGRME
ncbi:MAG: MBG domain-containing protein, partial [Lentisphaerota bacterium]